MREVIGFIVLQLALGVCGLGLLCGLGLARLTPGAILAGAGPALLTGTTAVVLVLILLLVLGVAFTLFSSALVLVALTAVGFGLAAWRSDRAGGRRPGPPSPLAVLAWTAATAWGAFGAYALARVATTEDDARIWSLKGVTLTYYDRLRPAIFLSPATAPTHHVYPLFQPVLEALVNRAMGRLELRFFHSELWLLLIAALWTAAYLLWWRARRAPLRHLGLIALVVAATTPFIIGSIGTGYADITGGMLLGVGALALGLWLDGAGANHLWLGTLLLAAAANTKDEDLVGAGVVLLALAVAIVVRGGRERLGTWLMGALAWAAMVAPWRIWCAAHGLRDSVQPSLPHALSPIFIGDRLPELSRTARVMAYQVMANWGWQGSVFLALCILALIDSPSRRLAGFYLLSFLGLIASLLWLYTTTPLDLGFLLRTSAYRTIDVFMMLTPFASAHLVTKLLAAAEPGWDLGWLSPGRQRSAGGATSESEVRARAQ